MYSRGAVVPQVDLSVPTEPGCPYPQKIGIALTAADADRLYREGKISAFLGIEGGHAIEDSLDTLRDFYSLGVRVMTLTWMYNTNWADASGDTPVHGGLTEFGAEVVREMNRLGMVVDVSHASDETFYDTLEVSKKPVVASHSCVRALNNHHRNMTDDMLRALAQNGGVIGINFYSEYLAPAGTEVTVGTLVDHIEYAVDVAGIDHVGLGSDFDGVTALPAGLDDVSKLPAITEELLDRGFAEKDIEKILGGNMLRVFRAALGG
jgi:membrane dipeptidase